jgi:transposase
MPAKISSEIRAAILAHHQHGLSCRKIISVLTDFKPTPSRATVARVIREYQLERQGIVKGPKSLGPQNLPSKRTKELVRKIDKATDKANPPTQKQLAQRYEVSASTIRRILNEDIGAKLRKKCRTHALSNKQAQQRLDRGPHFLELIKGNKWKYVISLDEAWLGLNDVNVVRDVVYQKKGKQLPPSWTRKWKKQHAKKVMYAAGVSARGVTGMYFVPSNVKVNRWVFIEEFLKPIVENDIPRLYPGEEHKVVIHFDSAGSHTTPEVYQWLDERKVKYIKREEWLSNSPDLSPMDYGPNGIFKGIMGGRKPTTLDGLMRTARQVWKEFPLETCYNTTAAWSDRVNLMLLNQGFQIENLKN